MWKNRKSNKSRFQSLWDAAMPVQGVRNKIYAESKEERVFRRRKKSCVEIVLLRSKRSRRRKDNGNEQS